MFINKDELRRLANKKASRPMIGQGIPAPNEGIDGDFRLNNTLAGVKLYAKFAGQWFAFSPDSVSGNKKTHFLHGGHTSSGTGESWFFLTHDGVRDTALHSGGNDNDEILWVAPFNGAIKSLNIRGNVAMGDTTIKIYKANNGDINATTQIASKTFSWSVANTTYAIVFDNANFQSGEGIIISSQVSSSSSNTTSWTLVIEEE